jgi:hypothetical protein
VASIEELKLAAAETFMCCLNDENASGGFVPRKLWLASVKKAMTWLRMGESG